METPRIGVADPRQPWTPQAAVKGGKARLHKNEMVRSIRIGSPAIIQDPLDSITKAPKPEFKPKTYVKRTFLANCVFWAKWVVRALFSFFRLCLRCFRKAPPKIDNAEKAASIFRKYKDAALKQKKFECITELAELYHQHPEAKTQYEKMTRLLSAKDFDLWMTWHSKTLDEIIQSPELLARAADCTKAILQRDEIWHSESNASGLRKILAIGLKNSEDQKRFQDVAWFKYKRIISPAQSLEDFLKNPH